MEKMDKIYYDLTGVDLDKQCRIWDERGKGYYGEYLVFKELFLNVEGNAKFLMNLQVPVDKNRTTEIDLLMIHETGIYVFEVKHYKGTIYGNIVDKNWTQYFRTAPNSIFKNPVLQNDYHIKAIQSLFPDIPVFSAIVFSNDECDIRVSNGNPHLIITDIFALAKQLQYYFQWHTMLLDMDAIDDIFGKLKIYSSLQDKIVISEDGTEVPFYEYVHEFKKAINTDVQKVKDGYIKATEAFKSESRKIKTRMWISIVAVVTVCLSITLFSCRHYQRICNEQVDSAMSELHKMEKKFAFVDMDSRDNAYLVNHMIQVSDVKLVKAPNQKNTALFSCTLTNQDAEYGIILNEDTTYIIMMNDGTVREYRMFGERLHYSYSSYRLSGTADKMTWNHANTLKELEIYNVEDISEIAYIKITNISLWKLNENNNAPLVNGLELALYSK